MNPSARHHTRKAPGSDSQTGPDNPLCEVTVHIRGIDPVKFVADAESPLLQLLMHTLQTSGQAADKMIYLDYEDNGASRLYMMKSSLLGIETAPLHE